MSVAMPEIWGGWQPEGAGSTPDPTVEHWLRDEAGEIERLAFAGGSLSFVSASVGFTSSAYGLQSPIRPEFDTEQSVFLSRPIHGLTTWYACFQKGLWFFASNLDRLRTRCDVREIEPAALGDLAVYGLVLPPITFHRGILTAPAGGGIRLFADGDFEVIWPSAVRKYSRSPIGVTIGGRSVISVEIREEGLTKWDHEKSNDLVNEAIDPIPADIVLRHLGDTASLLGTPMATASFAMLTSFLAESDFETKSSIITISDPGQVSTEVVQDFLSAVQNKTVRNIKVQAAGPLLSARAGFVAQTSVDERDALIYEALLIPEWRRSLHLLSRDGTFLLARDVDHDLGLQGNIVPTPLRRLAFSPVDHEGINLFAFAMARLFHDKRRAKGAGFLKTAPSVLGRRAGRLRLDADRVLSRALFAGLTADYLLRFGGARMPHSSQLPKYSEVSVTHFRPDASTQLLGGEPQMKEDVR